MLWKCCSVSEMTWSVRITISVFFKKKKSKKYLKYLLSILATEVLEFFTTEVQNHWDESERWFLNNLTDDQLRIYKTKIHYFQLFFVTGMISFSSVPNLNLPTFLAEFVTCFHDNLMFHWARQIDNYKIYSPDNHNFGHVRTNVLFVSYITLYVRKYVHVHASDHCVSAMLSFDSCHL